MTWIVFNPEWLQADVISVRHRLLLLLLERYDVTLRLLLLLGVCGIVISRTPARVQLHVKFLLFASHLVVLGLLGATEGVPLLTHGTHQLATTTNISLVIYIR